MHILHWERAEEPVLGVVNCVGHCVHMVVAGELEYEPIAHGVQTELVLAPEMDE